MEPTENIEPIVVHPELLRSFSHTLINSLLNRTTGISVLTTNHIDDTIIYTNKFVAITMWIDSDHTGVPTFRHDFLVNHHAKSLADIEELKESLERANSLVTLAKTLFEFQIDFIYELEEGKGAL